MTPELAQAIKELDHCIQLLDGKAQDKTIAGLAGE